MKLVQNIVQSSLFLNYNTLSTLDKQENIDNVSEIN